jgi:hypothetical protein
VSITEILIIGATLVLIQTSKQPPTPLMERLADIAWLLGSLGSLGFAVPGVIADSDRRTAIFALILALVLICGFPLMVST